MLKEVTKVRETQFELNPTQLNRSKLHQAQAELRPRGGVLEAQGGNGMV